MTYLPFVLRPPWRQFACTASLVLAAAAAHAAGFQLNETSASGLGTAFAAGAAEAADASTLWSNVAGMARLGESQASGTLHLITPSLKFRNVASRPATGQGLGGSGGDAGGTAPVPNVYVAKPLDNGLSIGLGVTAPWGLVTEYDDGWVGRFQAIKSSIETININPSLAWKASDRVSVGLGLNVQHMKAEFTNQVNYAGALLNAAVLGGVVPGSPAFTAIATAANRLESRARVTGSDTGYGWNAGLMFDLDDRSRIGIGYRSSVKYRLDGMARFANPAVAAPLAGLAAAVNGLALYDGRITSDVEIPAVLNLSYFTRLDDRWDLMVDAQWTQWSTVRNLTFLRADGSVLQDTPENFKNSWKLAFGANYRYNPQWTLRGGIAFDQSPVQRAFLTPRLPDGDRTWLTLGARYTISPKLAVDFGAAYIFVKKTLIDHAGGTPNLAANGLVNGYYDSRTVILSAQLNYVF